MTLLGSDALAEEETPVAPYDSRAPHYDAFFNTTPSQQYLPTGGELEVFLNYTSQESALGGTQPNAAAALSRKPSGTKT